MQLVESALYIFLYSNLTIGRNNKNFVSFYIECCKEQYCIGTHNRHSTKVLLEIVFKNLEYTLCHLVSVTSVSLGAVNDFFFKMSYVSSE